MTSVTVEILNRLGVHARPTAQIAKACAKYQSEIMIEKNGLKVDGKSILGILSLSAEHGSKIIIRANGPDEKDAVEALKDMFKNQLFH